jgi:hypothetical protein
MPKGFAALALTLVVLAAAGCGGDAKVTTTTSAQGKTGLACSGTVRFPKAKFALHSGLAFGAFHRYILKPYRAGTFRKEAPGRTKALVKASAAALFAYHELKVARTDAVCDGPRLRRLAESVSNALSAVNSLRGLKTGVGLGAIDIARQAFERLGAEAKDSGTPIADR